MKKRTISALTTLAVAAVIFIGNALNNPGSGNLSAASAVAAGTAGIPVSGSSAVSTSANSPGEPIGDPTGSSSESSAGKQRPSQTDGTQNTAAAFPSELLQSEKEGIAPFGYIEAHVDRVTDGDTFHITYKSKEYKVRMLDIDTPESVKSGVKPQPYSEEASSLTKEMLTGKKVKLLFEKDTTDQFGRLLAHVLLEDETYYNAYMVENGYAICVFYSPNTLLKEYFNRLQDSAIKERKGFWQLPEKERPFIKDSKGKYVAAYKLRNKAA
ncbi:thermonuclease precursor [Ruminiclostridium hungatei]|uniref:Thermonuclease n=1 Tax=Ruminiclostridium hungatei TaxID=48256 RepID=A0A1V4SHF7_RUMHU|nr:thermonuclease family protein [Ruminiclostridium hungatei]OPX42936.1 thermonuclease precursor [Ruminiclostridium hungatei]